MPQDPEDEPVSIDGTRAGRNKPENEWHPGWVDAAPLNWVRAPLACVGHWGSGGTPRRGNAEYYDGDIPWLKIGDLNDDVVLSAETHITELGLEESSAKMVPPGAVLIAMYGSIGKAGIAGIECCTNQAIAHCVVDSGVVTSEYLFRLIRALREDLTAQGKGGAQSNISQTVLKHLEVLIPPLAEQRRIVARVDELMDLLDRLEEHLTSQGDAQDAFAAAAVHHLGAARKEPAEDARSPVAY